jgi:hypothetical protein
MFLRLLRQAGQAGLLALAALLGACGGGSDSGNSTSAGSTGGQTPSGLGQLAISLTDSQGCDYKSVWVTVEQVRMHQSDTADDGDGGWRELNLSPARRVDLLELRNGVSVDLGTVQLPAGKYTQVRLVLAANGSAAPYANQLDLDDGTPVALKTPSAQQSGLKLKVEVHVEPGQTGKLVLDFDPCRSVVKAGNSGRYNLKPVIRAYVNPTNDIEGYTVPGAIVSAQQGGVGIKSTTADAQGKFVLWPVDAGSYDVVITGPELPNAVLTGVQVTGGRTTVSTASTPLLPAPLEPNPPFPLVSGTVMVNSLGINLIDANLRALQTVGTYRNSALPLVIEAATTSADAESGAYGFSLPSAAPQRAVWQAGVTAYTFTQDASQAGLYTIEARAAGFALPKLNAADIRLANDRDVDFNFP